MPLTPPVPVLLPGSNTIVPAIVGLVLCGVQVILVEDAQNEYWLMTSIRTVLPETSQFPLV